MLGEPLGTLRSWWLHVILTGTLCTPSTLLGIVPMSQLFDGQVPHELPAELLKLAALGTGLGILLGPIAFALARWGWQRSRLLALALGPVLGALCAVVTLSLIAMLSDGHWPRLRWDEWLALSSFGAVVLGPPWVAYLAVRARGRAGHGVITALPVWALAAGIVFIAAIELRIWME